MAVNHKSSIDELVREVDADPLSFVTFLLEHLHQRNLKEEKLLEYIELQRETIRSLTALVEAGDRL